MNAATSTIVKEDSQSETCIYCGAKLKTNWEYVILDGLEYKITECENGHEARVKINKHLNMEQTVNILMVGWSRV